MRSLTLRMGVVSIVMLLATIVEGRAFLDFSLNKRSLEDEINGFLDRVKQTKANLCLYGCVRFQTAGNQACRQRCRELHGKVPELAYEVQAMADNCYANCMKDRENTPEEISMCSKACMGEWMIMPDPNPWANGFVASIQNNAPDLSNGLVAAVGVGLAGAMATLMAILSPSDEAGAGIAFHASEALSWWSNAVGSLDFFLPKDGGAQGG